LVTGDTYPVKEFLKSETAMWNPKLKGWVFKDKKKGALLTLLRRCPDVQNVQEETSTALAIVAKPSEKSRAVASPQQARRSKGAIVAKATDELSKAGNQKNVKVTESAKRQQKLEKSADGSKKKAEATMSKQRKITCKTTGRHLETKTVSKKRKVVETKGKIVEVETVEVKRVRSKR